MTRGEDVVSPLKAQWGEKDLEKDQPKETDLLETNRCRGQKINQ